MSCVASHIRAINAQNHTASWMKQGSLNLCVTSCCYYPSLASLHPLLHSSILSASSQPVLSSLLPTLSLISGRKAEAHRLRILFGLLGFQAGELHGNLTQTMRLDGSGGATDVLNRQTHRNSGSWTGNLSQAMRLDVMEGAGGGGRGERGREALSTFTDLHVFACLATFGLPPLLSQALESFRRGEDDFLIATDVAARVRFLAVGLLLRVPGNTLTRIQ